MKLFCMLVGVAELAIGVAIEPHHTIDDLKERILAKLKLAQYSTQDVGLFLAKRDGQWLSDTSNEVEALEKGDTDGILDLLVTPLKPTVNIADVFTDLQCRTIHVLVLVPHIAKRLLPRSPPLSSVVHSEARRKRWRGLNEKLAKVNKRMKTVNHSNKSEKKEEEEDVEEKNRCGWSQVMDDAFRGDWYTQERKSIPKKHVDFLHKYLKDFVAQAMDPCIDSMTDKCRLYIVPLLSIVCRLFEDARLEVNTTVEGKNVHADVCFDFVLTRGNKRKVCILIPKKTELRSAAAQAVAGCEAVADTTGMHVVYGIVTDFARWKIYRSSEDSILRDSYAIPLVEGVPDYAVTVEVCEKLYAMLSDDDDNDKEEGVDEPSTTQR